MELEAAVNGHKKKTGEKLGKTLRFDLELASPSEVSTNEFSYARLVDKKRKKDVKDTSFSLDQSASADDPFGDGSHDKLVSIAKQFEEKYGPKKKRKRLIHDSDLIDRGYGYDLTDSFVDDSELYEDFVPYQLDTEHGGFYINTGSLNFKTSDDIDDDDDFVLKKKRKPAIKKQPSHHAILASQKLKKAKQHVASHKTPKKLLAVPSSGSPAFKSSSSKLKPPAAKRPKKQENGLKLVASKASVISSDGSRPGLPTPSIPISIGNISVSVPIFDHASKSADGSSSITALTQNEATAIKTEKSSESDTAKSPPVLPQGLPVEILTKVYQLEEMILRDQDASGKISTKIRNSYDEKLVDIELVCKAVNSKVRIAVFEYLGYKLNVSRGTISKRVKQTLRKREDEELKEPLFKLKQAIDASMPEQIAQHEEARASQSSVTTDTSTQDTTTDKQLSEVDEDVFEDSLLPGGSQPQGSSGQEGSDKPPPSSQEPPSKPAVKRAPKRKYKWNDETKKLLCDVVQVKVASEERMNRTNRANGEETIIQFLDEKVKALWPKGWMQKSVLFKMSEPAHSHFTHSQPKKVTVKKEKLVTVKKEPPIEKLVIKKETLEKYAKPETVRLKPTIKKEPVEPKKVTSSQLATANPATSGASLLPQKMRIDSLLALLNEGGTQVSSVLGKTQPKKSSVSSNTAKTIILSTTKGVSSSPTVSVTKATCMSNLPASTTKIVTNVPTGSGSMTKTVSSASTKVISNLSTGSTVGQSVITSSEKKRTVSSSKVPSPSQKKLSSLISPPKHKVVRKQTGQVSVATNTHATTMGTTTGIQLSSQGTRITTSPSTTLLSSATNPNTYFLVTSGGTTSQLVLLPQSTTQTQQQHTAIVQKSSAPSLSNTVIVTSPQIRVDSTLQQKSLQGTHATVTREVKSSNLQLKTKAATKSTAFMSPAVVTSPLVTTPNTTSSVLSEVNIPSPSIHLPRTSLPELIPYVPKAELGTLLHECPPGKQPPSSQIPTKIITATTSVYSTLHRPDSATSVISSKPAMPSPSITGSSIMIPPLKTTFTQSPNTIVSGIVNTSSYCSGSATHSLASLPLTGFSPGLSKLSTASSPISSQSQSRELLSPLKSPVEQIFEEHSYHGSQEIFSLPTSSANRQGPATGSSSLMDTGSEVVEHK